jgi:hypothetical protein
LAQDNKHKTLLQFIRKIVDVPIGYSKEDLVSFRSVSLQQYPALVPLIDQYIALADKADTNVANGWSNRQEGQGRKGAPGQRRNNPGRMHLFDLLRERRLFPLNSDLSEFAGWVLPNMSRKRFDKMSRGDIAARIIEYLETTDPRTREELEASMREAMASSSHKPTDSESFFSKWEKIIKGIEL